MFRMADALLDILACAPGSTREGGICEGMGDILYSLKNVLLDIGGLKSGFLDKLQLRMANSELSRRPWPYLSMSLPDGPLSKPTERAVYEVENPQETDVDGLDISDVK